MTNPSIQTNTGAHITPGESALDAFKASLRGNLIQPGDASYDEARSVYNAMHDRRPALIVQAAGVADVMTTVRFAADHDAVLAVRGGAHSVPGFGSCDDGVVLDLGGMRGIRVDPERRTARAEGGCTWGDFNHATAAFGLATTGGIVSTTGIAGLTLGGGMGYLSRRCGLSCDNLLSADVVTAEGRLVTCHADQNEDLFWALRGGGGNFGVVTSFEYQLHPVADILGGPTFYPLDGDIMRGYREWMSQAPEQLSAILGITLGPPLPFLPEKWHHQPVIVVLTCWSGAKTRDDKVRRRLDHLGPVAGQYLERMPYPVINTLFDELLPPGLFHYWKGCFTRELTDAAIDVHVEHGARVPCLETAILLFPVDGACHRVTADATAFAWRDADFSTVLGPSWREAADSASNMAWGREYYDALRPHSAEGGYVNFMSGDDGDRVRANYGQNFERLAAVKARYDPENLFRLNQNIAPSA